MLRILPLFFFFVSTLSFAQQVDDRNLVLNICESSMRGAPRALRRTVERQCLQIAFEVVTLLEDQCLPRDDRDSVSVSEIRNCFEERINNWGSRQAPLGLQKTWVHQICTTLQQAYTLQWKIGFSCFNRYAAGFTTIETVRHCSELSLETNGRRSQSSARAGFECLEAVFSR